MEITWILILILLGFGLLFGIICSITGIGGGPFYVAFLILFLSMPITEAIDTSTFIILISSGAALITFINHGRVNLKIALIYSLFSIMGSLLCTLLLFFIQIGDVLLKIIFVIVLFVTSANMVFKILQDRNNRIDIKNHDHNSFYTNFDYKKNLRYGIPFFILAGFLANLIGIGGGIIFTPTLHFFLGFPIHCATAVSIAMTFFTAIVNTLIKIFIGEINYSIGIIIGIGAVIGSYIGAKFSSKVPEIYIQSLVAITLAYLAIQMLL
ncbi:MAG: sulfite exporter TauE/SafE family protein [Promethearchaeota archaeon]|nr:MAG: sulfite exporter TauE/SafE family protein [Candidatus Lokiarchaeota archaeon]